MEPGETTEAQKQGTTTKTVVSLRYAAIAAGAYTSSVLVFKLSAPSLSESLERVRRAFRLRRRQLV
jgi:hypothetical protein